MPIRFHLDEQISTQIAAGLRRRHIDVTTTADASLIGAPDIAHVEYALASGRVIATHDDDLHREFPTPESFIASSNRFPSERSFGA